MPGKVSINSTTLIIEINSLILILLKDYQTFCLKTLDHKINCYPYILNKMRTINTVHAKQHNTASQSVSGTCCMLWRSGDKPPCMQNIVPSTSAAENTAYNSGSSIKDIHTEGEGLCHVKSGQLWTWDGVFKLQQSEWTTGRPQTVPFLCDSLQLLDNAIARNGSEMGKSHPILWYRVMNLVLHSNFDFCIFYILIYF